MQVQKTRKREAKENVECSVNQYLFYFL